MRNFIVKIQSSINPQKRKNVSPWFPAWFPPGPKMFHPITEFTMD